jgi:uncharacterized protein (DUF4415 family)
MPRKDGDLNTTWTDPDDAPEWDDEDFRKAELKIGDEVVRPATGTYAKRGRPRLDKPKTLVTLRLDPDVLARLRESGPGWQSKVNEILKKAVEA